MVTRSAIFCLMCLAFFMGWYVVSVGMWVWYLIRYGGFEIVMLGFIIDGYFFASAYLPLFTITAFFAWTIMLFLRQRLLVYTHTDEIIS
jgi:hypothetical protein